MLAKMLGHNIDEELRKHTKSTTLQLGILHSTDWQGVLARESISILSLTCDQA